MTKADSLSERALAMDYQHRLQIARSEAKGIVSLATRIRDDLVNGRVDMTLAADTRRLAQDVTLLVQAAAAVNTLSQHIPEGDR